MRRSRLVGAATAVLLVPLIPLMSTPAQAAPGAQSTAPASDTRELKHKNFTLDGKKVATPPRFSPQASPKAGPNPSPNARAAAGATPPVGTVRQWLGLDDFNGLLYRKDYTLRGVGNKIEVWVANDTAFPAGDCRTQIPGSTTVTDAQVADLVTQFDTNMFPKETAVFSTPPDRDGSNALLGPDANGNGGDYTGQGDNTVALIDNVRDDNFYTFPAAPTYIAGFFSASFNELLDRNVMTIDAYDWAHRTGANPPNEPTGDLCTSRPARPRLYEGTFAHEWQHLLQYYTDPGETTWLNEGLSDFAQTLVGYVDGRATVFDPGADSHIYCFQGYGPVQTPYNTNPRDCGGPENSLNLWGEFDPNAVLADYGNAYSFMLFLYDRYGTAFISRLHRDGDLQGLASLKAALAAQGASDMYQVIHDYQTMNLVDKIVGESPNGSISGISKKRVTTPSLRALVNLANPRINANPGAAPNGADYVVLQRANGSALRGNDLKRLVFEGASTLPTLPLKWTIVSNDPDRNGNPVLWSGNASNLDASAVTRVTVPTTDPTLRFLAKYGAEQGFDYGYVQVSTDGGATYTSVAGDKTIDAPFGPGLNGTTVGFEPRTFDLSAYAGQDILVAIRYVSDASVNEGGLLVDDVTLGGTVISDGSSLDPFDSPTEIRPTEVTGWNLRLVGINEQREKAVLREFKGRGTVRLDENELNFLDAFPKVVAIVSYDEPTEQVQQYAPYLLKVNNVIQPGGAGG